MEQQPEKPEEEVKANLEPSNVPIRRSTRVRVPIEVKEVKKSTKPTGNSLIDMMNSLDNEDDDDSSEYSEQSESQSSSSSSEEEEQEKNGSKRAAKEAKIIRKEEERQEGNSESQPARKDQEEQENISTLPKNQNVPDPNALPQDSEDIPKAFVYELPKTLPNFLINKLITKYK